jgi:hypothetical protein
MFTMKKTLQIHNIKTCLDLGENMDFGLKEIGITFMVGAFTILGIELVVFYLSNIALTGFFRDKLGLGTPSVEKHESESVQNMRLAVFVGLAFAVGILAEDVSYKFVDNKLPFGLESKYDLRVKVLIEDWESKKSSPLAKDLAKRGAFEIVEPEKGKAIQNWIINEGVCLECQNLSNEEIRNSIIKLYYHSKNKVYLQVNYYDEMKKIQTRTDFARSVLFISVFYIAFALLLASVMFADLYIFKNFLVKWLKSFNLKTLSGIREIIPTNVCFTIITLFLVSIFSWLAYDSESREYNKRAFGYFATMALEEKQVELKQIEIEKLKASLLK